MTGFGNLARFVSVGGACLDLRKRWAVLVLSKKTLDFAQDRPAMHE
jgi:hypothetical protein